MALPTAYSSMRNPLCDCDCCMGSVPSLPWGLVIMIQSDPTVTACVQVNRRSVHTLIISQSVVSCMYTYGCPVPLQYCKCLAKNVVASNDQNILLSRKVYIDTEK